MISVVHIVVYIKSISLKNICDIPSLKVTILLDFDDMSPFHVVSVLQYYVRETR